MNDHIMTTWGVGVLFSISGSSNCSFTTRGSGVVQALDICTPLFGIGTVESTIIGNQTVDFSLYIRSLCIHSTAASVTLCLIAQLRKELCRAYVISIEIINKLVCL